MTTELLKCGRCKNSKESLYFYTKTTGELFKQCILCTDKRRCVNDNQDMTRCASCNVFRYNIDFEINLKTNELYKQCKKCRTYRENNLEKIKEKEKLYRENNLEKIKERKKLYRENNLELVRKQEKTSKCRNWEKRLLQSCKSEDKKRDRDFNLDVVFVNDMLEHQDGLCNFCGDTLLLENGDKNPKQVSIDRIDNSLGHIRGNCVLSCLKCNLDKGSKHPLECYGIDLDNVLH